MSDAMPAARENPLVVADLTLKLVMELKSEISDLRRMVGEEKITVSDIARRRGCSPAKLCKRTYLLPNFGVPDVGKYFYLSSEISYENRHISDAERLAEWEALSLEERRKIRGVA